MKRVISTVIICALACSQVGFAETTDDPPVSVRKQVSKAPPKTGSDKWKGYTIAAAVVVVGVIALIIASRSGNGHHHHHNHKNNHHD